MLVLTRVRSKKKSPQRARLQSSTFGGFLDLVKISAIRSEVGPKSDPVRSRSEVSPKSDPVRSRSEVSPKSDPVRSRSEVRSGPKSVQSPIRFWPQLSLLAVLMHFGQGSIPLYERSTSLIQAQTGANHPKSVRSRSEVRSDFGRSWQFWLFL